MQDNVTGDTGGKTAQRKGRKLGKQTNRWGLLKN